MSKRKIVFIVLGTIASVLIALVVLANVLITPERVRETVIPLAEEALHRKVELSHIDVSLLSGISLENFIVKKKAGHGDFVAAEKVVLRYSLLSLLMLKVKVDEITLVKPTIEVVRNQDGSFNFSDMTDSEEGGRAGRQSDLADTSPPIDLHISKIAITNGYLQFLDNIVKEKPAKHVIKEFNLKATNVSAGKEFPIELSADWNNNTLGLNGKLDFSKSAADLELIFNKVRVRIAGGLHDDKIEASLNMPKISLADLLSSIPEEYDPGFDSSGISGSLQFGLDVNDDVIKTSGFATEINGQLINLELRAANIYDKIIKVNFSASSESLMVDKIIPPAAESNEKTTADKPETAAKEVGPFTLPLNIDGTVRIGKAVYNQVPVTDLLLKVTLENNILLIEDLSAAIAGGAVRNRAKVDLGVRGFKYDTDIDLKGIRGDELVKMIKPELANSLVGVLGGEINLSGAGTLPETIKKKLSGKGVLRLTDGRLQKIPALNATAALLGVNELREIVLDDGNVQFSIEAGQVSINSKIAGPTTRIATNGQVGLDGQLNLRSSLALSPELGGRLHAQGKMARYLGDEEGWTTVPIRIRGDYAGPDVGLDSKSLKKQAEKTVKKEVQKSIEQELQRGLKKLFGN